MNHHEKGLIKMKKDIGNIIEKLLKENERLQMENQDLKRHLEEAGTNLHMTLSTVSHELCNTLTLLMGTSRLLEQEHPKLTSDENWINLCSDLTHMQAFLADLTAFGSAQEITLSRELLDLNSMMNEICRTCQPLFDSLHKRLVLSCLPFPAIVYADSGKLCHVFTNLIKNGLEALGTEGTVSLRIRSASKEEASVIGSKAVAVEIKDSGSGIPKDLLEKIFKPFYTNKPQGTGLGLPIARAIIHAHSGTLTASSHPGKGSVFTVVLPALPTSSK